VLWLPDGPSTQGSSHDPSATNAVLLSEVRRFGDVESAMLKMAQTDTICSARCANCGALNTSAPPHFDRFRTGIELLALSFLNYSGQNQLGVWAVDCGLAGLGEAGPDPCPAVLPRQAFGPAHFLATEERMPCKELERLIQAYTSRVDAFRATAETLDGDLLQSHGTVQHEKAECQHAHDTVIKHVRVHGCAPIADFLNQSFEE
jgi:hypothetical protein